MQIFSTAVFFLYYLGFEQYLNQYIKILTILLYLLYDVAYTLTTISNPGVISFEYYLENYKDDQIKIKNFTICERCNIVKDKDKGIEHCNICDICIIGNDHHCPWTSKCIGKKNLFGFRFFIFSVFLNIIYIGITSIILTIIFNPKLQRKK